MTVNISNGQGEGEETVKLQVVISAMKWRRARSKGVLVGLTNPQIVEQALDLYNDHEAVAAS